PCLDGALVAIVVNREVVRQLVKAVKYVAWVGSLQDPHRSYRAYRWGPTTCIRRRLASCSVNPRALWHRTGMDHPGCQTVLLDNATDADARHQLTGLAAL